MTDLAVLYVAAHDRVRRDGGLDGDPIEQTVAQARDLQVVRSMLERIDGATVFAGTLVGHRLEESSNRWVVTVEVAGEREDLRTDRLDTPQGRALTRRVRRWRGHRVVIFKEIERTAKGDKGVRVLAWLEPIEQTTTVSSDQAEPPRRPRREDDRGEAASGGIVAPVAAQPRPDHSPPDGLEPVRYDPGPAPEPRDDVDPAHLTGDALAARAQAAGLSYLDIAKPVAAWARDAGVEPILSPKQLRTGRCGPQVLAWVDALIAQHEAAR